MNRNSQFLVITKHHDLVFRTRRMDGNVASSGIAECLLWLGKCFLGCGGCRKKGGVVMERLGAQDDDPTPTSSTHTPQPANTSSATNDRAELGDVCPGRRMSAHGEAQDVVGSRLTGAQQN
jgi:hypothetical protein